MEDSDKSWSFPTFADGTGAPSLIQMREVVIALARELLRRLSTGSNLLDVVRPTATIPAGWEHWHRHPELFFQVSGATRFFTPTGEIRLDPGRLLLLPPLAAHREVIEGEASQFQNFVFTMAERSISYHLALAPSDGSKRPRSVLPDVLAVEEPMAGTVLWLLASDDADVRAGALRAFLGMLRRSAEQALLPGDRESDRVRRAQQLIRSRLGSSSLSVVQVAHWVGCHPDHLTRTFKSETDQTVVGFIATERLNLAHSLLSDPRIRVAEAARLSGFTDPAYFSRLYRKRFGTPPSGRVLPRGQK